MTSGPGKDFYQLSKALKAAGNKGMRRELNRRIKQAGKPMIEEVRKAARAELPKRGGLNETIATRKILVSPRTGKDPGIKLVMPRTQPGYLFGDIQHPVFERDKAGRKDRKAKGDKSVKWVEQHIGPGKWFDDTIVEKNALVREQLDQAIQSVADEIVREAGR